MFLQPLYVRIRIIHDRKWEHSHQKENTTSSTVCQPSIKRQRCSAMPPRTVHRSSFLFKGCRSIIEPIQTNTLHSRKITDEVVKLILLWANTNESYDPTQDFAKQEKAVYNFIGSLSKKPPLPLSSHLLHK